MKLITKAFIFSALLTTITMNCNADTITYTLTNSTKSTDLTMHWPIGCTPDLETKAKGFVICTPDKPAGIVQPGVKVTCQIVKTGFEIACLGQKNCPIALYPNDSCSSNSIATATAHLNGTFDNTQNVPNSGFNVTSQGNNIYV